MPHLPAAQVALPCSGVGQDMAHRPQLSGAVPVSTQAPPQLSRPAEQPVLQLLWSHTSFAAQLVVHPPHREGSLLTSTHDPLQSANGGSQTIPHFPSAHVADPWAGIGQALPQAPQFSGSLLSLRQLDPQAENSPKHANP